MTASDDNPTNYKASKPPKTDGKGTVSIEYREQLFEVERRQWTTEKLIELFGVPAGHILDLIEPDGEIKELKPGRKVNVREGMVFTSHVPIGQSS